MIVVWLGGFCVGLLAYLHALLVACEFALGVFLRALALEE